MKRSSDATKALRPGDIAAEIENVTRLVAEGQADTYIFMTNMSVDAPVALEIGETSSRHWRAEASYPRPAIRHPLDPQQCASTRDGSPSLRSRRPHSDPRRAHDPAEQGVARALDTQAQKIRAYGAHREAVKAITEHGFVLLLGNPSSGKSAIGAILSTIACENRDSTVLVIDQPSRFRAGLESRMILVVSSGSTMRLVQCRSRGLCTGLGVGLPETEGCRSAWQPLPANLAEAYLRSRSASARPAKSCRVHQRQRRRRRRWLSMTEKAQILYNHINYGNQSQSWKSSVKPHLGAVAAVEAFLPGIAERLGDPNFTKSLAPREASLVQFMKEPREHLVDTINALDERLRAALMLVYVHRGAFNHTIADGSAIAAVAELTGILRSRILDSFAELMGSFLKASGTGQETVWSFAHPTIADALTEILREKPHMMAALLRGATVDTILTGFMSEGQARSRTRCPSRRTSMRRWWRGSLKRPTRRISTGRCSPF